MGDQGIGGDRHVAARGPGIAAGDIDVLVALPFDAVVGLDGDRAARASGFERPHSPERRLAPHGRAGALARLARGGIGLAAGVRGALSLVPLALVTLDLGRGLERRRGWQGDPTLLRRRRGGDQ